MNILEIFSPTEHKMLVEKLGNLSKLGMPKLIQVLKQSTRYHHKSKEKTLNPLPQSGNKGYNDSLNRFQGDAYARIGANSEIIDGGVVKKGLADIRKAFKTHVTAKAIALYVDNKPVGFAKFDSEDIGHASREGVLAYDISAYQDKIDAFDDAINQTKSEWEKKYSPSKTKSTTILSKESIDYSRARDAAGNYKTYIHKHVGEITSTAMLSKFIDLIMNFGEVTFKLVIGLRS